MNSILTSMKKLLGITEEYEHFDMDLIMHINSVFATLHQIGVGPSKPFRIMDEEAVWSDFIQGVDNIESVKSYMYLKLKLLFDPPLTSSVLASYERQITEYEARLNWAVDTGIS